MKKDYSTRLYQSIFPAYPSLLAAYQAAIWFGSSELSMATALGVFGNQLGVGLGFLVPPLLVPDPSTLNTTSHEETMAEMTKGW